MLDYNVLVKNFKKDKAIYIDYIKEIFRNNIPFLKNIILEKPLLSLLTFYPLPFDLQIDLLNDNDKVVMKNNYYFFMGDAGDRVLFANRRLPFYGIDPIPFAFPITDYNNTKIVLSDTFYFEITLGDKTFRKPWKNECLSIGFGTSSTPVKGQVGWSSKSWGFHSDDGSFINNNKSISVSNPWKKGETYGVGIKYISKDNYKIFLTKEGILIKDNLNIVNSDYLIPMIGLDLSVPIKINWGNQKFMFDLERVINCNQILSHENNFLKNNKIDFFKIKPAVYKSNNVAIWKSVVSNIAKDLFLNDIFEEQIKEKEEFIKKKIYLIKNKENLKQTDKLNLQEDKLNLEADNLNLEADNLNYLLLNLNYLLLNLIYLLVNLIYLFVLNFLYF